MPQILYLIRHGETAYNKERRMQGWIDIPLNRIGHAQAKSTADRLQGNTVHALYSSDLKRAHSTAKYVAKTLNLRINLAPALRERDMGIFSGWAWEKEPDPVKEKLWLEFEAARDRVDLDWNLHQGETLRQMTDRVTHFLSELDTLHFNQHIALTTHGGTINRILEYYAVKQPADGYRTVTNASILVITRQDNKFLLSEL